MTKGSTANFDSSIQFNFELITQALNLLIKYTDKAKTMFGNIVQEHLMLLIIITILMLLLHSALKTTKQSLPKPRGKK